MHIGTLAEAARVTTKTIRFYEHSGLLAPPPRNTSGYREYPTEAIQRVLFIRDAQGAGLSLAEIREVLALRDAGRTPCREVIALIAEHLARIEQHLADLSAARDALLALARRAADTDPDTCADSDICIILADGRQRSFARDGEEEPGEDPWSRRPHSTPAAPTGPLPAGAAAEHSQNHAC